MNCPICDQDLSILDLTSATEHVNTCVEHGPSVIELDDSGQIVVKKNLPPGKQRKICPICDKTFQNLKLHFKICALKYDVPPDLMLQYWQTINLDSKKPKKFPRDLLTGFINKCVKEGRIGEQVDYAKALVLSLSDGDPEASNDTPDTSQVGTSDSIPSSATSLVSSSSNSTAPIVPPDATNELLRNANLIKQRPTSSRQAPPRQKYRLEFADDAVKRSNIALRIDREMAASRVHRYEETLRATRRALADQIVEIQADDGDDECMIIQDNPSREMDANTKQFDPVDLNKLFFLSRLKDCNGSELCEQANCMDHDLHLLLEDFKSYSGKSMDADPVALPLFNEGQSAAELTLE